MNIVWGIVLVTLLPLAFIHGMSVGKLIASRKVIRLMQEGKGVVVFVHKGIPVFGASVEELELDEKL